ncbi:MAG: DUF1080 domain-containing protein [Verrucomicrobiota bacterium]
MIYNASLFLFVLWLNASLSLAANEISLFDGKTMGQWQNVNFGGEGQTEVYQGNIFFGDGIRLTGISWKGEPPSRMNYEIELEARKNMGLDFFLALTVPVGDSYCTWVNGGWGGQIVGISSIDDLDAAQNETSTYMKFAIDQWYHFKMRVEPERLRCWIDKKQIIDVNIKGKKISLRPGAISGCTPLGIAAFQTEAEFRNIIWRNLSSKN